MCDGGARAIVLGRLPTLPAGGRPQSAMVCPTKEFVLRFVAFLRRGLSRVGLPVCAPPRSLHCEDFSISCCIRLHLLRWGRLAGQETPPAAIEIVKERDRDIVGQGES